MIAYITASGGLWKSTSGGIAWEPIFDEQPVASIGAVAIDQSRPDVIWVGTGEGNPRNSQTNGNGVYKSLDGGKNWMHLGLDNTRNIHRLIIDPTNPNVIYVGAIGAAWGDNPERGVYKTTDGGKSWKMMGLKNSRNIHRVIINPQNPDIVYAAGIGTAWGENPERGVFRAHHFPE